MGFYRTRPLAGDHRRPMEKSRDQGLHETSLEVRSQRGVRSWTSVVTIKRSARDRLGGPRSGRLGRPPRLRARLEEEGPARPSARRPRRSAADNHGAPLHLRRALPRFISSTATRMRRRRRWRARPRRLSRASSIMTAFLRRSVRRSSLARCGSATAGGRRRDEVSSCASPTPRALPPISCASPRETRRRARARDSRSGPRAPAGIRRGARLRSPIACSRNKAVGAARAAGTSPRAARLRPSPPDPRGRSSRLRLPLLLASATADSKALEGFEARACASSRRRSRSRRPRAARGASPPSASTARPAAS